MSETTTKRRRGRPRNAALDELQRELAITRRHAGTILKEQKNKHSTTSENSEKLLSPLAEARLQKTLREISYLETRIRAAELEERALSRELLYSSEAVELLNAALAPIADGLRTWPKALAVRLHGQPVKAIEDTLAGAVNGILATAQRNVATFKSKTSREL
jgi:hypothetical protein